MPSREKASKSSPAGKRQGQRNDGSAHAKDAVKLERDGAEDTAAAGDALEEADELEGARVVALAAGISDLTRAEDIEKAANRLGQLSDVVAAAGVADVAEGVALLATSEDIETMSALVGVMSEEDLEEGLKLARISGELRAATELTRRLHLPVLASILHHSTTRLDDLAVHTILRSGGTRALAAALAATGTSLTEMSAEEVAEGITRTAVASTMAEQSQEMEGEAIERAVVGMNELEEADELGDAAREDVMKGVVGVAVGASETQASVDATRTTTTGK